MRGRGPGWEEGDLQAFIKLGSDDRNFYLYRAPAAKSTTWEPEFVIDLETWRRLRAELENRWLQRAPPSGADECGEADPNAYVACEGPTWCTWPIPASIRPISPRSRRSPPGSTGSAAIGIAPEAELWVDDIRLSEPVSRDRHRAWRWTPGSSRPTSAAFNAYVSARTGSSGRSTRIPTYRTTGAFQLMARTGGSTGSCPRRSAGDAAHA